LIELENIVLWSWMVGHYKRKISRK